MTPIQRKAISQANDANDAASLAYERMLVAKSFDEYRSNWSAFLDYSAKVFEKIKNGAMADQRTKSFWGSERKMRKEDPLLQWLHQARNVEQHGLQRTIEHVPGRAFGRLERGDVIRSKTTSRVRIGDVKIEADALDLSQIPEKRLTIVPSTAKLLTVTDDRFGDSFDPPTQHLGRTIHPLAPTACVAMIKYHKGLIWRAFQSFSQAS
ncbi:type II toxin-antitoxin system VapC family toxin [Limimaricola cinnabarinus]|uniref:type II toxin-antitoxin system VapC family toxin n=1 Tax=Limimaricola cinnabarinus TaxID=1125964 RepID=UPI0013A64702|nr:type II toxin-antitoxin system VapC family toxin [Limimaricola cinnabarinus]